ncbi:hypothetical protein PHISCL_09154 [Aspergillus sclerotialis]|uniref:Uncharacterized protein n=1 Tax=Aspergillus sclerotialis TaxID=2070753 RepID=A0A3A2ZN07_9EURO|nr:hypothetical protein PHISCL_09154 [Aspergillus sclerotialis]
MEDTTPAANLNLDHRNISESPVVSLIYKQAEQDMHAVSGQTAEGDEMASAQKKRLLKEPLHSENLTSR